MSGASDLAVGPRARTTTSTTKTKTNKKKEKKAQQKDQRAPTASSSQVSGDIHADNASASVRVVDTIAIAAAWRLWGRHFFFATGHHNSFNRLQYSAAFVGFDEFVFARAGSLLWLNTFGSEILTHVSLPFLVAAQGTGGLDPRAQRPQTPHIHTDTADTSQESSLPTEEKGNSTASRRLDVLVLAAMLFQGIDIFASMACVAIQRRHLMVWAIFAPKFVMDGALHLVAMFTLIAVSLFRS